MDANRLDRVLEAMVFRSHARLPISRKEMEGEGLCSQGEWKVASDLLLQIGLRQNEFVRKLETFGSPLADLAYISRHVYVGNRIWVSQLASPDWTVRPNMQVYQPAE